MKILSAIIKISCLLLFIGCSDKYQSLYDASPAPNIQFNKDTLSIREKDYNNINQADSGMLTIVTQSPTHQLNLQINGTGTKVHLEYKGIRVPNLQPMQISGGSVNLFCNCDTPGIYPIQIYLTNQLDKINTKQLIVHCLQNKQPQASFTIEARDSTIENYAYQFDAGSSHDPDGIILWYHYAINGLPYITNTPLLQWTFHSRGLQTVSLHVEDDLQASSDTLTKTFLIP